MHKEHEFAIVEHTNDAEIMRAIRYLDQESGSECARMDTGAVLGVFITLATALTSTMIYIGLYIRAL